MQESMVIFTFFVFDGKYPFWDNLVPKFKIVCLKWKLVPRIIQIYKIFRWCLPFLFSNRNTLFGHIPIYKIQWWCSLFPHVTGNTIFGSISSKNSKIISLNWNLVFRLNRFSKIQLCFSFLPFSCKFCSKN